MSFSTLVNTVLGVRVMMFVKMKSWKVYQVHKELYGPCSLYQPFEGVCGGMEGGVEKMERGENRRILLF